MVVTIGIWSLATRGLCKISTVESQLWDAADCASPRKTVWFLTIMSKTRGRGLDDETDCLGLEEP